VELGLAVDDAAVLSNSNRIAVRLLPCDVLARVAPDAHKAGTTFELEVARRLSETDCPITRPDPRVEPRGYGRDGFAVTFWTYHEPQPPGDIAPAEYAQALQRLHAGMREIDLAAPHFNDRVAEALAIVGDCGQSPDLGVADRDLLSSTLRELSVDVSQRATSEQLLHGEPHPGNVLRTRNGLLFTDLETCCRGPVEFDIAHYSRVRPGSWEVDAAWPDEVARQYPGADRHLVRACWMLMLAIVAAWRCDRNDQFPGRDQMRTEWTEHVRAAVEHYGPGALI
jgi:hypothetical protein